MEQDTVNNTRVIILGGRSATTLVWKCLVEGGLKPLGKTDEPIWLRDAIMNDFGDYKKIKSAIGMLLSEDWQVVKLPELSLVLSRLYCSCKENDVDVKIIWLSRSISNTSLER